ALGRRRIIAVHLWEALLPGGVPTRQVGIIPGYIRVGGPPLIQHLEEFLAVDGLVDGLSHLFFRPRDRWVQFPRRATIFGIAPLLFVLRAEVEPTKIQDDLLRYLSATDELIPLTYRFLDEVLVDLGEVGFTSQELRQTRRLFERPGHLQFFPVHCAPLPVWCRGTLVEHIAVWRPFLEDIRPGAGRLRLVRHLAFFIPLRLAEDDDGRGARVIKRPVEADYFAVHDDLVIIDDLDPLDLANAVFVPYIGRIFAARVLLVTPQGMTVHDGFRSELAVAVGERH